MFDDLVIDAYIIDYEETNDSERQIQLEIPNYYEYEKIKEEVKEQEPKRVIIIDI